MAPLAVFTGTCKSFALHCSYHKSLKGAAEGCSVPLHPLLLQQCVWQGELAL